MKIFLAILALVVAVFVVDGAYDDGMARNKFMPMSAAAYLNSNGAQCVKKYVQQWSVYKSIHRDMCTKFGR